MLLTWFHALAGWQFAKFPRFRNRSRVRRRPASSQGLGPALESLEGRVLLSFSTVPTFTAGAGPAALASADFNGDGKRDVVVANESANTVSVLLGNGNGTLQTKIDYPVGAAPDAVTTGDFNGDGKADIVTANFAAGTISVLLGNGDGTFRPRFDFAVAGTPVSLATGDFNGDGHDDLAVAVESTSADSVEIFRGNGNGTFLAPTGITTATTSRLSVEQISLNNLAVGDINGDGKLDLVAVNNFDSPGVPRSFIPSFPQGTVSVVLGNGDGTFQAPVNSAVGLDPRAVAVGDFNGDGRLDFAVANTGSASVSVFLGGGNAGSPSHTDVAVGGQPVSLGVGDFNGDGRSDFAVSPAGTGTLTIYSGQTGGTFLPTVYDSPINVTVVAADMNGDGKPDLIATDATSFGVPVNRLVEVMLDNANGTFPAPLLVANPGIPLSTQAVADFNGDGIPDRAVFGGHGIEVDLGLGDGGFGDPTVLGVSATSVGAADVNGDGTIDLILGDSLFGVRVAEAINFPGWDNRTGGAVSFAVSAPEQVTAGTPVSFTLMAVNAAGNPVPGFLGTVDLDVQGPGSTSAVIAEQYTFTPADGGRHVFIDSALTKAGVSAVSFVAVGMPTASAMVDVAPAALAKFVVTAPGTTAAGTPFSFTMSTEDKFGNVETGYTGTVHFGALSNDTQALLPPDYTFTAADAGTHTFSATLFKTAGAGQPLIAVKDVTAGVSGFANISVTPLAASSITMTRLPNSVVAGSQEVIVTALDTYGNQASSYAGTVHFTSSDLRANLPADYTFSGLDQGAHAFFPALITAGTQSLAVTDAADAFNATQTGIAVVPGTPTNWVITAPATSTAGAVQTITFAAMDAFGNVATNYSGVVHFTSSDAQASLPPNSVFTPADAGSHTFSFALKSAGAQSITLTDVLNPSITATQSGIVVTAAAAASLSVSGLPTATTAGAAQNVTVSLRDAFGNVAAGYAGTVAFSSSDPLAGLPASYTFTAADAGVHTFSVALKKAGIQSIAVTDLANPALAASQAGILVSAAAVSQFGIVGPTNATQGVGFNITVSALDTFGNVVAGYRGKVHFSTTATNFGLPSDFTFSNNDNGVHIFSVTLNTLGFQTLTVTDTTTGAITGKTVVDVLAQTGGGGGGGGSGGGGGGP